MITLGTVVAAFFVLLGAGLVAFWPGSTPWPRGREAQRLASKYGVLVLAALLVLVLHVLLVAADAAVSEAVGLEPALTSRVAALEGDLVPSLARFHTDFLDAFFAVVYLLLHPFTLVFSALLFVLSDDERAARATLLAYPLAYAVTLPFWLFVPITNVNVAFDLPTPAFDVFPGLAEPYYASTAENNAFPALHVALALLLANAGRYSRNRVFRAYLLAYAPLVVLAPLYLQLNYLLDVAGGIAVAVVVGGLVDRVTKPERLALRRVKADPEEALAIQEAAARLVARTTEAAAALGIAAEPELVGSVAKDTYLRDRVDIDVFARFAPTTSREDLERKGLELGRAVLPDGVSKYAEHPYIRGTFEGWPADVVPCYTVASASERMSAVDRTPFHTRYVLERMSREQRDEARLLKQFCRGTGVYGAEAKTRGFSGYLCEILVLKYGSFAAVVEAGARWRPGTFLTLETIEGSPQFTDPLVVLDPVDPGRNAASAVADETLRRFTEACRAYLARPGLTFFFPRQRVPIHPEELARILARRRSAFLVVAAERPDVLEDHLHDQMRKAASAVETLLSRHEFDVVGTAYAVEPRLLLLVEVARAELPEEVVHAGPPVKSAEHAERFRKAWGDNADALSPVWEERGRLFVKRRREFRRAADLLRARLPALDAGKHVTKALREGYEITTGLDVAREETAALLTEHVDPRAPWDR